jgi:aspartate carbamoyltransferase catalytic subunit
MNDGAAQTQLGTNGRLRHLLTLENLSAERITSLLDRAESLREQTNNGAKPLDILHGRTVINLFL